MNSSTKLSHSGSIASTDLLCYRKGMSSLISELPPNLRIITAGTLASVAILSACSLPPAKHVDLPATELRTTEPTASLTPLPTLTATPAPTVTPSPVPSPTELPSPTPFGCIVPPEDYTQVIVAEGIVLNQRTIAMLEQAQVLFGGSHEFLKAITQGSYNVGVDASFGTHDGGGAVDISIRDSSDWHHILYEESEHMIASLRRAGFAAWLRDTGVLYSGSPVHIHAIAIGDKELSPAAQDQLTGEVGYFRGYNGLPENPQPDTHGGPILCPWMLDMGYRDLQ